MIKKNIIFVTKILIMRKLRKHLVVSILFLLSFYSHAQLFVSSGSFLYVNNQYVTVTQDVNLASAGHIYLRNQSQLLQKTTGGSANIGLGTLSAFQEGTSNNFGYNYWCSPIGLPIATVGNSNFGISLLKRPTGLTTFGGEAITNGLNGSSTNAALNISSRWIYTLTTANQYSSWNYIAAATTIAPGQGFTMKGVSGSDNTTVLGVLNNPGSNQRYDFRGKPNDGNISIPVGNSNDVGTGYTESTLTGNPYPSAINLNLFLLENSGYSVDYVTGDVTPSGSPIINGNAYFWEHQKPATSHTLTDYVGGYGTYVPNNVDAFSPGVYISAIWDTYNGDGSPNTNVGSSGINYRRMFSPVGQGFIIKGAVPSGIVEMKNIYRVFNKEGVAENSQFERNANTSESNSDTNWPEIPNLTGTDYTQFSKAQVPQIRIQTILNNQFTREIVLAFNPNAIDGYDFAFDATTQQLNLPTDAYFPIVDNKQFVISTLPFEITKRIPFAVKASSESNFRVLVGNLINFDLAENIYLYDKQTTIYHDIKNGFVDITLPAGNVTDRFEITFLNETLSAPDNTNYNFDVIHNNENKKLSISNPNLLNVKSVSLFDITGKLIFNKEKLAAEPSYEFSTSGLSDSVYIVKINTAENQEISKKVLIFKE
jgi:hypothetical protein